MRSHNCRAPGKNVWRVERECKWWRRGGLDALGPTMASASDHASSEPEAARRRSAEHGAAERSRREKERFEKGEKGGGRWRRRRTGMRWASHSLAIIFPILLAFRSASGQTLSVNFPDGAARTFAGTVTVPQGNLLALTFTGRSVLFRCFRLPALVAFSHATRQPPPPCSF